MCIRDSKYPGVPQLRLHAVRPHEAFRVGELQVTPIEVMHARLPILGYRVGRMAYITDMKTIEMCIRDRGKHDSTRVCQSY